MVDEENEMANYNKGSPFTSCSCSQYFYFSIPSYKDYKYVFLCVDYMRNCVSAIFIPSIDFALWCSRCR